MTSFLGGLGVRQKMMFTTYSDEKSLNKGECWGHSVYINWWPQYQGLRFLVSSLPFITYKNPGDIYVTVPG